MSEPRPKRVFISRTTAGLKDTAEKIADILRSRGCEVIHQPDFTASPRDVKGMLVDHLINCDAAICLVGPAHGMLMKAPVTDLGDPRTEDRLFSYTQLEMLVLRKLRRPVFTYIVSGDELIAPFTEPDDLAQRQQDFIKEFATDQSNVYKMFDTLAALTAEIERIPIEYSVFAGKRENLPYASLGTLFKGREDFLTELRQHLTAEAATVIKGRRTIHGMGGVGKTRAAIEYAWKHADDYNALLFVSADSPESLQRNLAALCGPLVLNLPEQSEKDQSLQVAAALKWLQLNPKWFLILDNVDTTDAAREATALLTKLSAGHIVITSRISDWSGHVKSLDLDVLSDAAAIAFLDERTDERRIHQPDDPSQVAKLVRLLDCLALALEQAGAHISHRRLTYADYLAVFEKTTPAAIAWHDEKTMHYPRSLAITYQASVAQLSPGAKELFRILSWFAPDPIPRDAINSLPNPDDETRHLSELENLHLATFLKESKAFTIHRLLQEITRQQQPDTQTTETTRGGFLRLVKKTRTVSVPPPALLAALSWVDALIPFQTEDVRTWPIVEPLASHATAIALVAADRHIPAPTARILNQVALFYNTKAQCPTAEPLMRRAMVLLENKGGTPDHNYSTALNNLAGLLRDTDRLGEAEPLLVRVVEILENKGGEPYPNYAGALNNLAQLLKDTNRLAEAEPLMRRVVEILAATLGENHPDVATSLDNLAGLLQATNRLAEAELLIRRALAIDEASFGKDHPKVATDLESLAGLLQATNRLAEAEPLLRRALAIDEASFGKDHPKVATDLESLARLLLETTRLAEAEPLLRRALAIDEASFGKDHSKVANDLNTLVAWFYATNRLEEAEPLMRRALAIDEASFGKDHPQVAAALNNLAQLLQATNRLVEAEPLLRRGLAIDESSFGKDHPNVATALNNLAQLLQAARRLEEAEPLMRRVVDIFSTSLGENHPNVAISLNNLAQLLKATNRLAEAEPLMRKMVDILVDFTVQTERPHPHLQTMINNYSGLLMEMGDTEAQAEEKIAMIMEPISKK